MSLTFQSKPNSVRFCAENSSLLSGPRQDLIVVRNALREARQLISSNCSMGQGTRIKVTALCRSLCKIAAHQVDAAVQHLELIEAHQTLTAPSDLIVISDLPNRRGDRTGIAPLSPRDA